jgi:hypothetical protein
MFHARLARGQRRGWFFRYWILDTGCWIGWIGWIKLDKLENKQHTYLSKYLCVNSFSSFSALKEFSHECTNGFHARLARGRLDLLILDARY